ncbi:MAG TPA: hypothetical protein VF484_02915, partial [Candidatus Limnocylindrales bacterium]
MLAVWLGVGAAVAPPPAAAILCTVVNPCYTLTVAMTGIGEAQVTGDGGINCTMTGTVVTGTCSGRFYGGALVSLTGESGGGTCMTMEVHTTCGDIDMEQFTMPKAAGATYHVAVDYQLPINVAIHKA